MIRILYIDDDKQAHTVLRMVLPPEYEVVSTLSGSEGINMMVSEDPDIVLLDLDLPDVGGLEVLSRISAHPAPPPVVMLTGYDEAKLAVQAMKLGAVDYIVKPYALDALTNVIRSSARRRVTETDAVLACPALAPLVGESPAMKKIKQLILVYAPSDKPVFISGESGTGKELVARLVHRLSERRDGPFVARNCGAIPHSLVETELFGSERGAFTDAVSRPGSFEQAYRGTLFLDEIGELSPGAQVKLLRALEEVTLSRVGGVRQVPVDVRVVAATNADIRKALTTGRLRQDLFYRLSTLPVRLPPLRERMEDIPLIVEHLLRSGRDGTTVCSSAMQRLAEHEWPGNVRELRNVIDRAVLLSHGEPIRREHILISAEF